MNKEIQMKQPPMNPTYKTWLKQGYDHFKKITIRVTEERRKEIERLYK